MRKLRIILLTVLSLLLIVGCSNDGGNNDQNVFVLGTIAPLTGNSSASGNVQYNAVKMAVDEINAKGGIDGKYQIVLKSEDDEANPAKAVTVAQKLVNQDNIQALVGALNSSSTLAIMEIMQEAKIPQVTPSSSAPSIVEQGNEFIFRTTATDITHIKTLLSYASKGLEAKTIAVLYESSDFGIGANTNIGLLAPDYGLEVIESELYNTGEKDFSVQLTKIKEADPDVVILWGYYTEVALICRQVQQIGLEKQLIGTGYNSPELIVLGGDAVENLIFTTAFTSADPAENVQAFDKKYRELYNEGYDQNAPQAYDSVYLIADAITRAQSTDGVAIRDAILNTSNFEGVAGKYKFESNGEMIKTLNIVKIVNGEHTIVEFSD